MTHTMHENVRPFLLRENACETYLSIQLFRPKSDEQRVIILSKTDQLDPLDIKQYVRDVQDIQANLIRINPEREQHESKAPAYLTRLLDNLTTRQKDKVYWLRDQ